MATDDRDGGDRRLNLATPRRWQMRSEAALLRGIKRNEPVAEFVRRHWDKAHRTAFLLLHDAAAAEDIAQESMLAAVRGADGFDQQRPLAPWLHRIVVNRSLDLLRVRSRRAEVPGDVPDVAAPPAEDEHLSEPLMEALRVLDADQRAAIVLRHLLGYGPREISDLLAVPEGTVRSRLSRGLALLREALEEVEHA